MMRISIVFRYTILVYVFTSCIFHPYTWQGINPPGKNKASFKDFRGKNTNNVEVSKDDLLFVSYYIEVTQGTLILSIKKERNKLWEKQFSGQSDRAEFQLPVAKPGVYKIVVEGKKATGSLDINYKAIARKTTQGQINKSIKALPANDAILSK